METLVLLLRVTLRPTVSVLTEAAGLAFQVSPVVAKTFAQRLVAAVTFCQAKKRRCSSAENRAQLYFESSKL